MRGRNYRAVFWLGTVIFLLLLLQANRFTYNLMEPILHTSKTPSPSEKIYQRIINLGLPKTGTTSLYLKLKETLGEEQVTHWGLCSVERRYENYVPKERRSCFNSCANLIEAAASQGFEDVFEFIDRKQAVFTQIDCLSFDKFLFPQVQHLENIFNSSVAAETLFVLTTRASKKWIRSLATYHSMSDRFLVHIRKKHSLLNGLDQSWTKYIQHQDEDYITNSDEALLVGFKAWHEERILNLSQAFQRRLFVLDLEKPTELMEKFNQLMTLYTGVPYISKTYTHMNKGNHHSNPRKSSTNSSTSSKDSFV